jgi:hypothetical protein
VQSYLHLCEREGKRNAATKTAEMYNISHMTVRRYVAAHEAAQNVPEEPPELQYVPPPGGYDPPIVPHSLAQIGADYVAPIVTEPSQNDGATCEELMSSEKCTNEAQPQESTNVTAETSHPEPSQIHSAELETLAVVTPETSQPVIRERVITRIVRLPAETHQRGIYDRLAGIDATSIMGPELGAAVAFLLIVLTFWGMG